jgi:hypothetical protein
MKPAWLSKQLPKIAAHGSREKAPGASLAACYSYLLSSVAAAMVAWGSVTKRNSNSA